MKTFGKQLVGILLAMMAGAAQGAWADSNVTTEADLLEAVNTSQTVTLGADITLNSGRLDINDGATVTIDLNGHTLKRQMTAADDGGQVIYIADGCKLTITDSGTGGKITGGWANQGGGVYVHRGGELTISGGTITGNRAAVFGGGIHNEGTLNMTGGSIANNTAGQYGGGIYSNSTATISGATLSGNSAQAGGGAISSEGTLTLDGVTIQGNSAQYGGGVYMFKSASTSPGIVQLKGVCTITGNTASYGIDVYQNQNATLNVQDRPVVDDLYLTEYSFVTLTGSLTTGASIGLNAQKVDQTHLTLNYPNYHAGTAPGTFFKSKNGFYAVCLRAPGDEAAGEVAYGVEYIERAWDSTQKKVTETKKAKACLSFTPINGNDTSDEGWLPLNDGWYVVTGNSNYKALSVVGNDVHLIIPDGVTLYVNHVKLESGHKLTIYGQKGDTGTLDAINDDISNAAGIGSGGGSDDGNAGMINIHGGTINAKGNAKGAGIGGGDNHGFGPQANNSGLYVYGGSVTAQGGEYGAGIGSGDKHTDGTAGYVAIYGGTVNATGGAEGAGIGGGNEGHGAMFSIYGGTVTAQGGAEGAGIGGGDEGNSSTTTFYGGTVTATGGRRGAGIGGGRSGYATAISFHGGNITAIGGEQYSDVTAGGAAGIGGGYKGECRGIYFYGAAESVNGQPATVNATGKHGGAGIGSGYNSDFCRVDISGGNITATADGKGPGIGRGYTTTGMSRQSSDKKVLVNISGGDVTASSTNGGAGIGTGADTNFNGSINISGGKVTATGINGGAGIGTGGSIGGEKSFMYGWIVISGGEVIAKGEYNDDNSKVYWSGCGAGIGSGAAGEIYPEGLIQLLGGNVTASSMSGGAIGAGGTKVNENSQRDTWVDCPIQIHGDNTTLTLTSGQVRDMIISDNTATWAPSPAIRVHPDRGGYVSINGNLAVAMGSAISAEANRVSTLTTATEQQVTVRPCTHGSCTYTINGGTHTAHCSYCPYSVTENHAATGTCVCGYETGIYAVTLYTYDESNNSYSKIEQQVANCQTYEVPDCDDVPMSWEFVGWAETSTPGISFEQQTGETLIQPGETLTAATTLVARYKKIELRLTDTGTDNMVILNKYNKIKTASVTLSGRTLYKDGSWNTLCLPFAVDDFTGTPLAGATVKTLESASFDDSDGTLTLNFSVNSQTSIEAGKPYIVKWNTEGTEQTEGTELQDPEFLGVTISITATHSIDEDTSIETGVNTDVETDVVTFHGIFSPASLDANDKSVLYLGAGNKLYYPSAAMTVGSCRAVFALNGLTAGEPNDQTTNSQTTNPVRTFKLNFGDESTGITTTNYTNDTNSDGAWFTLDGRKLSQKPSQHGIYIKNGKKVVIK